MGIAVVAAGRRRLVLAVGVVTLVAAMAGVLLLRQSPAQAGGATAGLTVFVGQVHVRHAGNLSPQIAQTGDQLKTGDQLTTDASTKAAVTYPTGSVTRLDSNTILTIGQLSRGTAGGLNVSLSQTAGKTWSRVTQLVGKSSYQIGGPHNSTAVVRGTNLSMIVDGETVRLDTFDGSVDFTAGGKTVNVATGQSSQVSQDNQTPSAPGPIPAADRADSWTVFNSAANAAPPGQPSSISGGGLSPGQSSPPTPLAGANGNQDLTVTVAWPGSTFCVDVNGPDGRSLAASCSSTPPLSVTAIKPAAGSTYFVTDRESLPDENYWVVAVFTATAPQPAPPAPTPPPTPPAAVSTPTPAPTPAADAVSARPTAAPPANPGPPSGAPTPSARQSPTPAPTQTPGPPMPTPTPTPTPTPSQPPPTTPPTPTPSPTPAGGPVTVSTTSLPSTTLGARYSVPVSASGGSGSFAWSVASGALPDGLRLETGGLIAGTPTAAGAFNFKLTATDPKSGSGSANLSILVGDQPLIGPPPSPAPGPFVLIPPQTAPPGDVGVPYSWTPTAIGGALPYRWSADPNSLPAGTVLDASTGTISEDPAHPHQLAAGSYAFFLTVTDANGSTGSRAFTLDIAPTLPAFGTSSLRNAVVGDDYFGNFSVTGGPQTDVFGFVFRTYSYSVESGAIPPGVALDPASGQLSGQPSVPGRFVFSVRATDVAGGWGVSPSLTIVVAAQRVAVTNASPLPACQESVRCSRQLTSSGGVGPDTWYLTSNVPGLTLDSASGLLSGIPTQPGDYLVNVVISDTATYGVSASLALHISAVPPTLTNAAADFYNTNLEQGLPMTPLTLSATGGSGGPYRFAGGGNGLTVTAGNQLTGTPITAGSFVLTLTATDSVGVTGPPASYYVPVAAPIAVLAQTFSVIQGVYFYPNSVSATGGTYPRTWTLAKPPPAISIDANGVLVDPVPVSGNFSLIAQVTDSAGGRATGTITLSVLPAVAIVLGAPAGIANGAVGYPYDAYGGSSYFQAGGGVGPYDYSVSSGVLPPGLSLASGSIFGTPTAVGAYPFVVQAKDSLGTTATISETIQIEAAPPALTSTLYAADQGVLSRASLQASGAGLITFYVTVQCESCLPNLPPGIALASGGAWTGMPTLAGVYGMRIHLQDALGVVAITPVTFIVAGAAPELTTKALAAGTAGQAYPGGGLAGSGGTLPYSWALASGTLPPGVQLDQFGHLTGTPTAPGTYTITPLLTDGAGVTASSPAALSIFIAAAAAGPSTVLTHASTAPAGPPPAIPLLAPPVVGAPAPRVAVAVTKLPAQPVRT